MFPSAWVTLLGQLILRNTLTSTFFLLEPLFSTYLLSKLKMDTMGKKNSMYRFVPIVGVLLVANTLIGETAGFTPKNPCMAGRSAARSTKNELAPYQILSKTASRQALQVSTSSLEEPEVGFGTNCVLTDEEVAPVFRKQGSSGEKLLNIFGVWGLIVSLITCPIWATAMYLVNAVCSNNEELDPNRGVYDFTGKVWSRTWLSMTNSYPSLSGDLSSLEEGSGPYLYVANHASWLDIPVLCCFLDPVFKFIAKGELLSVPCIGQQLTGGNHILIDREDRRSQLRTFKEGCNWLNNGVSLMAFPEGKRSPDGRLMDFKGGVFSMALRSKVPIVPISISNTHAVFPGNAIFPVQAGSGKLHVHVHSPIHVEDHDESEIASLVREKLLSKIPECQHPLPKIEDEVFRQDDETASSSTEKNSKKNDSEQQPVNSKETTV